MTSSTMQIMGKKASQRITLKKGFEKAMIKLGHFSHCLILTKNKDRLFCYGTKKIREILEKKVVN